MPSYIYGASVQGIQSFIFQTNKLTEIVGASQLVDDICGTAFRDFCRSFGHEVIDDNIIMLAAGNIRYLVDEETCQKIVKNYPKYVSNYASGVTIVQAVTKLGDSLKVSKGELEKKLTAQKNRVAMPVNIGFMGLERARRTGGVAFDFDMDMIHRDLGTSQKFKAEKENQKGLFGKFKIGDIQSDQIPFKLDHITAKSDNAWLAIVHADGNGLGLLLRNLLKGITDNEKTKTVLAEFSRNLESATTAAAQTAFDAVGTINNTDTHYPLRPVVLGGDDMTVIVRADLAYKFTKTYLESFEEQTQKFIGQRLTACAGIAYVKKSYPFHYGVDLAENLTSETKKILKKLNGGIAPSALNFYKVQSSFVEELDEMKKRTHYAKAAKVSFDYGPYIVSKDDETLGIPGIEELEEAMAHLADLSEEETNGVAKLREWSAELHDNKEKSDFMMTRIQQVNEDFYNKLKLGSMLNKIVSVPGDDRFEEGIQFKSKVNDLLTLSSFKSPDKKSN